MSRKKSIIYDEILNEYLKNHKFISNRQLEEVKQSIRKNIDIDVYEYLKENNDNDEFTDKCSEYINIMLKHYKKRNGESLKDYNKRVSDEKEFQLSKRKIDTSAKRKKYSFNKFGKDIGYGGKIKVSDKKDATKKINSVKASALKSPKTFISKIMNSLRPSKKRIRIDAPKGFFNILKNKKEKNPDKFKNKKLKNLIIAGIFTLSGISIGSGIAYQFQKENSQPTEYSTEYSNDDNLETGNLDDANPIIIIDEEETEKTSETETETEKSDDTSEKETEMPQETTNTSDIKEETTTNISETENITPETEEKTEESYSTNEFVNSLMQNLNIDFDTEFQMSDGLFYETPEEVGNYGHYSNFDNLNLKITHVDIFYEDGRFISFDANSGYTISQIINMHPDASISYHIETSNGKILRMEFINIK